MNTNLAWGQILILIHDFQMVEMDNKKRSRPSYVNPEYKRA